MIVKHGNGQGRKGTVCIMSLAPCYAAQSIVNATPKALPIPRQMLAGGMAGACQIIVTTPMELLKIQMQDAGRVAAQNKASGITAPRVTAMGLTKQLIKERGIFGLYKGVTATAARDISFSIIYFPLFAILNEMGLEKPTDLSPPFWLPYACVGEISSIKESCVRRQENIDHATPAGWSFISGFAAAATGAFSVTPLDVIKTRMQTLTKGSGELQYTGILDCLTKTLANEGVTAFFKGGLCRVIVMAPLFGIAQTVYYLGIAESLLALIGIKY